MKKVKRPCLRCDIVFNSDTYMRLCKRCREYITTATPGMMWDNLSVVPPRFRKGSAPYIRGELLRTLNKVTEN